MAAPVRFPDDPNLQTKTVLADNDVFLIGSPADGNVIRGTTLASIKASIDIPEEFTVEDIPLATTEVDGLMASEDKTKLNGLSNYTHPATHSLNMITETETLKVMTADEREKLATLEVSDGSSNVFLGVYTNPQDMLESEAEVGQYCYLELDSQRYPVFCVDDDTTATTSWFAVGGGSVSIASEPPIITSRPLKVARHNVFYSLQITATNSPINFSATGLPTGLTCNPYTGLISGITSVTPGAYECTLYASNLVGTGSSVVSITVADSYLVEGLGIVDAYSLKKMSATATNCIQVRNGQGELADIGFDAIGELDTSALLAHCGYGDGFVSRWYNQGTAKSTNPYLHQNNVSYMPHIVMSGQVVTKNGHPAIFDTKYNSATYSCFLRPYDPETSSVVTVVHAYATANTITSTLHDTVISNTFRIIRYGGPSWYIPETALLLMVQQLWLLLYLQEIQIFTSLVKSPILQYYNDTLDLGGHCRWLQMIMTPVFVDILWGRLASDHNYPHRATCLSTMNLQNSTIFPKYYYYYVKTYK